MDRLLHLLKKKEIRCKINGLDVVNIMYLYIRVVSSFCMFDQKLNLKAGVVVQVKSLLETSESYIRDPEMDQRAWATGCSLTLFHVSRECGESTSRWKINVSLSLPSLLISLPSLLPFFPLLLFCLSNE